MTRDTIMMLAIGVISIPFAITHYLETQHIDLMAVAFSIMSVLYFVMLVIEKGRSK